MMKKYVRKNINKMAGYVPGDQPGKAKFIKLNTNENPYPPSPRVLEAIKEAATEDLKRYPDPHVSSLVKKARKIYGIPENSIIAGNGSDELLSMITRVFVGENDKVVYPYPTYTLYETLVNIQGGISVEVPFPNDFSLPENITKVKGKILFLANPNSPSGTFIPVERVEEVAKKFKGIVVVDEAYVDFADDSALRLVGNSENIIVLRSFSKSFSLAGIRLGVGFSSSWIIEEMKKVKDSYNVNRISVAAGCAGLGHISWMRRNARKIIRTRERLTSRLQRIGFTVLPSKANFVFARFQGQRLERLYLRLREKKILVRYFDTQRLADSIRITVGTDEEVNALLLNLEKIMETWRP